MWDYIIIGLGILLFVVLLVRAGRERSGNDASDMGRENARNLHGDNTR